jgi:subtilase family serine protease
MNIKTLFSLGIIFLFSSVFASAALDLQFTTAITQSPDPASAGNVVTFAVSFRTTGGAVTNLKIIGGVDGTQLFERTYASILADKVRTDSFTWTATAGSHTVWFELDPDHTCGDSNYANNRIEKAVTIGGGPAGKPDLYISSVTNSPTKFSAGDPVTLTIKVANKGTADSPASDLFMKDQNGKVLMTYPINGIPQGGQFEHSIVWTGACDTVLTIKVDTLKKADESDENNNTWLQTMKCGLKFHDFYHDLSAPIGPKEDPNGPDLTVKFLPLPINFVDGQFGALSFDVENKGIIKSAPCQLVVKKGAVVLMIIDLPAIEPGKIYPISYMEILNCGTTLTIRVDSDHKNIESNEDNNSAVKKIVCLALSK